LKKTKDHKYKRIKLYSTGKWVFYIKDGTPAQTDEQIKDIEDCLGSGNWVRLKTYIEPHHHNPQHIPELEKAVRFCEHKRADLIASRMGSRLYNFKIIGLLIDASLRFGMKFASTDALGGDLIDLNTLAGVAEARRDEISRRTTKTFARMKAQGKKLGGPNAGKTLHLHSAKSNEERFTKFAREMQPLFKQIQQYGATTLKEMADSLNARGIPSRYGGSWHPSSVRNVKNKILLDKKNNNL